MSKDLPSIPHDKFGVRFETLFGKREKFKIPEIPQARLDAILEPRSSPAYGPETKVNRERK